jgi:hypothetical protein
MGDYGEGAVVGALVEGVGISVHPRSWLAGFGRCERRVRMIGGWVWCLVWSEEGERGSAVGVRWPVEWACRALWTDRCK